MFAVVRTGGKQYRVAPGDKIVVEKLDGNAGDRITLGDVLLAGDGGNLKSTDGLTVAAEIVAQAKADKVTVFKKRRRHNYRRKKGHRQQHTILRIVAIGDQKARSRKAAAAPRPRPRPRPTAAPKAPKTSLRATRDKSPTPTRRQGQGRLASRKPATSPASRPKTRRPTTPRPPAPTRPRREGRSGQGRGQNPVDKKCCTC